MELLEHIRRGISTYLPALLLALAVTLFCTAGSTVFASGEGADPVALQKAAKAVSPAGAAQEDQANQGDQADPKEEAGADSLDAGQEADPPGEDSGSTGSETPEGLFPPERPSPGEEEGESVEEGGALKEAALPAAKLSQGGGQEDVGLPGKGTSEEPYEISTEEDLLRLASYVNGDALPAEGEGGGGQPGSENSGGIGRDTTGMYFALQNSIQLTQPWTPIGHFEAGAEPEESNLFCFKGVLDGRGFAISGLSIQETEEEKGALGFFRTLDQDGVVRNLTFEEPMVSGVTGKAFGTVAAINRGTVENVTISGGSVTGGQSVGGVCGMVLYGGSMGGKDGVVVSGTQVAGTAGSRAQGGEAESLESLGRSGGNGNAAGVGGGAGTLFAGGSISNLTVTGGAGISGAVNVGGAAGLGNGSVSNTKVFETVSISGASNIGGIVGYLEQSDASITDCLFAGRVSLEGESGVGGIAGKMGAGQITGCLSAGAVEAEQENTNEVKGMGGFVGILEKGEISGSVSYASVTGNEAGSAGGFAGSVLDLGSVTGCFAAGSVEGGGSGAGFVYEGKGALADCFSGTILGKDLKSRYGFVAETGQGESSLVQLGFDADMAGVDASAAEKAAGVTAEALGTATSYQERIPGGAKDQVTEAKFGPYGKLAFLRIGMFGSDSMDGINRAVYLPVEGAAAWYAGDTPLEKVETDGLYFLDESLEGPVAFTAYGTEAPDPEADPNGKPVRVFPAYRNPWSDIADWDQLLAMDLSARNRLVADIQVPGDAGLKSVGEEALTGVFDGGGYAITGLEISGSSQEADRASDVNAGLFSVVEEGALVCNLTIRDGNAGVGGSTVGLLAGTNRGEILSIRIQNSAVSGYDNVGSLIGISEGGSIKNITVEGCAVTAIYPYGDTTSYGAAGGLAGAIFGGTVEKAVVNGNVRGRCVGGVAGSADGAVLKDLLTMGRLTVTYGDATGWAGGILGDAADTEVSGMVSMAIFENIDIEDAAGGFLGKSRSGNRLISGYFAGSGLDESNDKKSVKAFTGTGNASVSYCFADGVLSGVTDGGNANVSGKELSQKEIDGFVQSGGGYPIQRVFLGAGGAAEGAWAVGRAQAAGEEGVSETNGGAGSGQSPQLTAFLGEIAAYQKAAAMASAPIPEIVSTEHIAALYAPVKLYAELAGGTVSYSVADEYQGRIVGQGPVLHYHPAEEAGNASFFASFETEGVSVSREILTVSQGADWIDTAEDFLAITDMGGKYALYNNISLDQNASPFGEQTFTGEFRGNGYQINWSRATGFTGEGPGRGLFGEIKGTVRDCLLSCNRMDGNGKTGLLAGVVSGTVENCAVAGTLWVDDTGNQDLFVGGVAGEVADGGNITGTYFMGQILRLNTHALGSNSFVGGIAGRLSEGGTIQKSYSTAPIAAGKTIGGLAGLIENGSRLDNAYFSGTLTGPTGSVAGGIAGQVPAEYTLSNSVFFDVQSAGVDESVGSLAGETQPKGAGVTTKELTAMNLGGFEEATGSSYPVPQYESPYYSAAAESTWENFVDLTLLQQVAYVNTLPIFLEEGDRLNQVTQDFEVPAVDRTGAPISWTAKGQTGVDGDISISPAGKVAVSPPYNKSIEKFTLNAKTPFGIKSFEIVVKNPNDEDAYFAMYEKEDSNYYYFKIKRMLRSGDTWRSGTSGATQTVSYRTYNGTVDPGTVFQSLSGNVTFGPDHLETTVKVKKSATTSYGNTQRYFYLDITKVTGGGVTGNLSELGITSTAAAARVEPDPAKALHTKLIYNNANNAFQSMDKEASPGMDDGETYTYTFEFPDDYTVQYFLDPKRDGYVYVRPESTSKKTWGSAHWKDAYYYLRYDGKELFHGWEDITNANNYDILPTRYGDWSNRSINNDYATAGSLGDRRAYRINKDKSLTATFGCDSYAEFQVYDFAFHWLAGDENAPKVESLVFSRPRYESGDKVMMSVVFNEQVDTASTGDVVLKSSTGKILATLKYETGLNTNVFLYSGVYAGDNTETGTVKVDLSAIRNVQDICRNSTTALGTINTGAVDFAKPTAARAALLSVMNEVQEETNWEINEETSPRGEEQELTLEDLNPVIPVPEEEQEPGPVVGAETFGSKALYEAVLSYGDFLPEVGNGDGLLQKKEAEALTYLSVRGLGISDLSGIEILQNLKVLDVGENNLSSLDALIGLSHLETLLAGNNRLTAIPDLSQLTSLKLLGLSNSMLAGSGANHNQITSLAGLEKLESLETLLANGNGITAIPDLSSMANLKRLCLAGNEIADISGIARATGLEGLMLDENRIQDVGDALAGLENLRTLSIGRNQLTSLENLPKSGRLNRIMMQFNEIQSLKGIVDIMEASFPDSASEGFVFVMGNELTAEVEKNQTYATQAKAYLGDRLIGGVQGGRDGKTYQGETMIFSQLLENSYTTIQAASTADTQDGVPLKDLACYVTPGEYVLKTYYNIQSDAAAETNWQEVYRTSFTVAGEKPSLLAADDFAQAMKKDYDYLAVAEGDSYGQAGEEYILPPRLMLLASGDTQMRGSYTITQGAVLKGAVLTSGTKAAIQEDGRLEGCTVGSGASVIVDGDMTECVVKRYANLTVNNAQGVVGNEIDRRANLSGDGAGDLTDNNQFFSSTSGSGNNHGGTTGTPGETQKPGDSTKAAERFTDVSGHWAADAIGYVVGEGLFNGTGETTFSPDAGMTRGMFVTVLGRMSGAQTAGYTQSRFTDVSMDVYYGGYVEWAAENGIVSGVGEDKFAPDALITREQMAVMLLNYFNYLEKGPVGAWAIPLKYTDRSQISDWAVEGVMFATMKEFLTGYPDGTFRPQNTATRAQVAALMMRVGQAQ